MKTINKSTIEKAQSLFRDAKNLVILPHVNPDGDAMGASLAMFHYLLKKGRNPIIISPTASPEFLSWLPGSDNVLNFEENTPKAKELLKQAHGVIILDFNDIKRIGELGELVQNLDVPKVMIDHHPNPNGFCDITVSRPDLSSTCELVYRVISDLGDAHLVDNVIGTCLYTGMMTDTGAFSYNSSNPETFLIVAELLKAGINKDAIHAAIFNNHSADRMKLLGYCLNDKLEVFPEIGAAFICLTNEELEKFHFQPGDTEGFVNYPLSIKGIRFSAFFIEKDNCIKASFRSRGSFPVNEFSTRHFNGGGHKNAAGGISYNSMDETIETFRNLLKEYREELIRTAASNDKIKVC